jgi:hypothetical protein
MEKRNRTTKITNRTFAIHADVPAIPTKPKIPAMIATIRKVIAHESNIGSLLSLLYRLELVRKLTRPIMPLPP